jgi:hypothetical protein
MTKIVKTSPRFKRTWKVVALALFLVGILVFPLPVHDADRSYVIQRDALRLRSVQPVLLDWYWQPFYDAQLIANGNPRWHLHSRLNFDLHALEQAGFIRMDAEEFENLPWGRWYEEGNVLVDITDQSSWHKNTTPGLRLHVHHGTMGGQRYTVHIYRCLLGRFARYAIEWVS